jgi:pimeloyl-ACP methyl ester carboxylesterase
MLLGVAAACSSDDADAGGADDDASSDGAAAAAAPVEEFTGSVDEFYEVPDPLAPGEPGDLIRTQPLDAEEGEVGLRIMYHSTDVNGDDRAVTGVAYYPTGPAPDGGWPVLASAHGTTGIASQCAPSRLPLVPGEYGVEGVRVATDYIGLGPVGEVHSYLSASAEGNAVVDSVAAARNIADAHAGDRWLTVGHSQGGHAALITNEIAAERLPDAELLGTVAVAPGAQMTETYDDDVQTRIIATMILFGAVDENPDIAPADYMNAEAVTAAEDVVAESCLGDIIDTMVTFAASDDFYVNDPMAESGTVASDWLEENDPGQVVSDSPLLLVQGGLDPIVVPARTAALYDRLCGIGQVVDLVDLPEADHGTELAMGADQISAWLAARLAGEPAPDGCS